jgi:hypothetical protein
VGVHNPREYQHVDGGGLGAQKRPCAGIDGGARGQDIVDQHQPPPGNIGLAVGCDLEGALHIAGALRPGQADLLLGRAHPPQRFGGQLDAGLSLDDPRQRPRLVVAAAPAALQFLAKSRQTSRSF